jgi:hypothetical protein
MDIIRNSFRPTLHYYNYPALDYRNRSRHVRRCSLGYANDPRQGMNYDLSYLSDVEFQYMAPALFSRYSSPFERI